MKIFVTGASGFLGERVIRRLLNEDHPLIALTRREEQAAALLKSGATPVVGTLESMNSWTDALQDVDIVIHLAAHVDTWGSWETFYRNITLSTERLAQEAQLRGVKRFIYVSSESVLQDGKPLLDVNEDHPYPEKPSSFYGRAKKLAEQALMKLDGAMEIVILRPTFIWGEDSSQLRDIVSRARKKQFPWIGQGKSVFEHVHVENVVEAIVQSLTNGRDKEIYFITNDEPMPVKQFFEELFRVTGTANPAVSLPSRPVYLVAGWLESLWSLFRLGGRPPLIRFEIEFLSLPRRFDINKAKRELQYNPPVTFIDGMKRMANTER